MNQKTQISNLIIIYTLAFYGVMVLTFFRTIGATEIQALKEEVVQDCDYWCCSHFLMYVILGILARSNIILCFGLGIFWEFIEQAIHETQIFKNYMHSNFPADVKTNMAGFVVGYIISSMHPVNIDLRKSLPTMVTRTVPQFTRLQRVFVSG